MYPLILFLLYPLCIECRLRITNLLQYFKDAEDWKIPTTKLYIFIELLVLLLIVVATFNNSNYGVQTVTCLYILTYIYEIHVCLNAFNFILYNRVQLVRMFLLFILIIILSVYTYTTGAIMSIVAVSLFLLQN